MSDESPDLIDKWVAQRKPTYPVVSLRGGEFERFLGVSYFPTAAVIHPDGTLLFSGSAGEVSGPLGEALSEASKGSLWPKSLAKVAKLMQEGDYEKSYATLLKLIEGGKIPEEDAAHSTHFKEYLEGLAETALAAGKRDSEAGFVYRAVQAIEYFAECKTPFPATEGCRTLLSELEELEDFKKEMKGGELYEEACALADAAEYTEAIDAFAAVIKKCGDTKIAEHARRMAEDLVGAGKYGFSKHCDDCRTAERACNKHKEDARL